MNKRLLSFFCILSISVIVYSQSNDLYDINYDKPDCNIQYDENSELLQEIYLQYESLLTELENKTRQEEKKLSNQNIEQIKNDYDKSISELIIEYEKKISDMKVQYEQDKKLALDQLHSEFYAAEVENVHKLETENLRTVLSEELEKKIREEYAEKYDQELIKAKKEIKTEVIIENHENMEKFKIMVPYVALILLVIIFILLIVFVIKRLTFKYKKKKKKKRREKYYESKYYGLLKKFNGDKTVFSKEIEDEKNAEEKEYKEHGLQRAEAEYQRLSNMKSINDITNEFDNLALDVAKKFAIWNSNRDDKELLSGICNNFFTIINDYTQKGSETLLSKVYRTKDEGIQIDNLLKAISTRLENLSTQVLSLKCNSDDLNITLNIISNQFKITSEKFMKEKF